MNRNFLLILLVGVIMFGCSSNYEGQKEVANRYPDGTPQVVKYFKWVGNNKNLVREIRYFPNGDKEQEGTYEDGKKDGLWIQWYPNGEKWTEIHYDNGEKEGEMVVYFKSGKVNYKSNYKNNRPHGEWIYYDGRGNKKKKVVYDTGEIVSKKEFKTQ